MNIDKAIGRNKALAADLVRKGQFVKADSVQLGIEALRYYKRVRRVYGNPPAMVLPGETRD